MARRTDRRLTPKRARVLKRFVEADDEERDDEIGQPSDRSEVATER